MKRVVIIGAGGHAREVADILDQQLQGQREIEFLGFVVEDYKFLQSKSDDLRILGDWSWLEQADPHGLAVICAVGSPVTRKRLVQRALSIGLSFVNVVSPSAHIAPSAKLGEGNMIFPSAVVSSNCSIGDHAIINFGSTISHDTQIHDFVTISPGVNVAGNVFLGEGCYLGVGSSVIPRISIGQGTVVGAGAVVIRDLPKYVTAAGVPAEVIKSEREVHE